MKLSRLIELRKGTILFLGMLVAAIILQCGVAFAASSSLSGDTTAKAGDTVYVTMSFSGSNTVAVGVVYSYNSCISSVSASNASPWGSTQADASQNQIGVGDYSGYENSSWNYILNGTTSVVSFRLKIADDAQPGDVAILKLTTVYYATTSNTLEQVSNQNLPTAGTASIQISVVGDTPTPTPTEEAMPTATPTETVITFSPEATVAPEDTAEPTATPQPEDDYSVSTGNNDDSFLDTSPIVPGNVIDTIDNNYYDSATGGYVVAATKDDRGKTTIYEVATDDNNETVYIKNVVNGNGEKTEEIISESQMNEELGSIDNYLADKDDNDSYNEAASGYATSGDVDEISATTVDTDNSFSYAKLFTVLGAVAVVFIILYFLLIRNFKEHKHAHSRKEHDSES